MIIDPLNFREEIFHFPNNMTIKIDFGVLDYDFKDPYIVGFERFVGSSRRSQLYFGEKLISEIIEDNPDELTDEEEASLIKNHIRRGEEFEKIINFPDGKVFKVEYWKTPRSKGNNLSIYTAKVRKSFLYDGDGSLISEIVERNPHYIDDSVKAEPYVYEDDFFV